MACQKCLSRRLSRVIAKCSDKIVTTLYNGNEVQGESVPGLEDVMEGDYVKFQFCLACGQIQGTFPVKPLECEDVTHCSECRSDRFRNILFNGMVMRACEECGAIDG